MRTIHNDGKTSISSYFFSALFTILLAFLYATSPTQVVAQQACEIYPGYTITCPSGYACHTISGQKTCYPASMITPSPGVTIQPSPTAQPTASPTAQPTTSVSSTPVTCNKALGDADCNNAINLADFEIWRKEFLRELTSKTADFNNDLKVSVTDFEIWRRAFYAAVATTPISPTAPVSSLTPSLPSPTASPAFDLTTCTITSTGSTSPLVNGTVGSDVICVLGPGKQVNGDAGNDIIYVNNVMVNVDAGAGADTILTGPEAASANLLGGADNDTIDARVSSGNIVLDGGAGADICRPGSVNNVVINCEQ